MCATPTAYPRSNPYCPPPLSKNDSMLLREQGRLKAAEEHYEKLAAHNQVP